MINEKTIVSSVTLLASLGTYFYAKVAHKDAVPYVMIGGFIGAIIGEAITGIVIKNKDKDDEGKTKNE
ncbi:hypothetical protein CNR22_13535 [Sphingobacteriaceae bacterium]|nr:hypothetical protein CNR22_13535 [Sphingobacteriaceae bacterium]